MPNSSNQTFQLIKPLKSIKLLLPVLALALLLLLFLIQMESQPSEPKYVYSVWAIPSEATTARFKKLMEYLRSEYGGPEFEPHVTVVGAIQLTESDARKKFESACQGVGAYTANVKSVATGGFFYQCVFLLLEPSKEVVEASAHCSKHFGYTSSTPYMPHASLLYGDLTEEDKQKAKKEAEAFDASVNDLSFPITKLALYKTDTEDKSLKSWEMIADFDLV